MTIHLKHIANHEYSIEIIQNILVMGINVPLTYDILERMVQDGAPFVKVLEEAKEPWFTLLHLGHASITVSPVVDKFVSIITDMPRKYRAGFAIIIVPDNDIMERNAYKLQWYYESKVNFPVKVFTSTMQAVKWFNELEHKDMQVMFC